jgi:hypothetical protein
MSPFVRVRVNRWSASTTTNPGGCGRRGRDRAPAHPPSRSPLKENRSVPDGADQPRCRRWCLPQLDGELLYSRLRRRARRPDMRGVIFVSRPGRACWRGSRRRSVGRSFHAAAGEHSGPGRVFHVLPRGYRRWDYGETLFAGSDMHERRQVLGRLAEMYVVIEGGPGTAHETAVALARSGLLIPVGRSGGHSTDLYARVARPSFASEQRWRALASAEASPKQVAAAVTEIVRVYMRKSRRAIKQTPA